MKTWTSVLILVACVIGLPLFAYYMGWLDEQDSIIVSVSILIGSFVGNLYMLKQKKSS